jgi:hypothetical protein
VPVDRDITERRPPSVSSSSLAALSSCCRRSAITYTARIANNYGASFIGAGTSSRSGHEPAGSTPIRTSGEKIHPDDRLRVKPRSRRGWRLGSIHVGIGFGIAMARTLMRDVPERSGIRTAPRQIVSY